MISALNPMTILLGWVLLFSPSAMSQIAINQPLPNVVLSGDAGGLVKGNTAFRSDTLKGKIHVIFYTDPDERDLNDPTTEALLAAKNLKEKFQSVAVINMAATVIPDFILSGLIADSQDEFPMTTYVEDRDKVLVKKWQLKDDSTNIVVTDRNGLVLFNESGRLSKDQISQLIKLLEKVTL